MIPVEGASRPRLARGVRLREDTTRDTTQLLAPERVLTPSASAIAVLRRCDGLRDVEAIVDKLAAIYAADREQLTADVRALLAELALRRIVEL